MRAKFYGNTDDLENMASTPAIYIAADFNSLCIYRDTQVHNCIYYVNKNNYSIVDFSLRVYNNITISICTF